MRHQKNDKGGWAPESLQIGSLVFHMQEAIRGLKGFLMRAFILAFVISRCDNRGLCL